MDSKTVKIRCVQHRMDIVLLPDASGEFRHVRYGNRCDSEKFDIISETRVNRETAQAQLISLQVLIAAARSQP
jgi:hypothetical protein